MPKLKTHKGMKKRFKVSANGKVTHKRCGSSHLNSHKSGKRDPAAAGRSRRSTSRRKTRRIRNALLTRQAVNPLDVEAEKLAAQAEKARRRRPTDRRAASLVELSRPGAVSCRTGSRARRHAPVVGGPIAAIETSIMHRDRVPRDAPPVRDEN